MGTYISEEKARLRDEAELAVMAWCEAGRGITRLPASRAPVCVPGFVTVTAGETLVR
jgi:hypothetical protein